MAGRGSSDEEGTSGTSRSRRIADLCAFSLAVPNPRGGTGQRQASLRGLLLGRDDSDSASPRDVGQAAEILEPREHFVPRTRPPQTLQSRSEVPEPLCGDSGMGAAREDLPAPSAQRRDRAGCCGRDGFLGCVDRGQQDPRSQTGGPCDRTLGIRHPARTLRLIQSTATQARREGGRCRGWSRSRRALGRMSKSARVSRRSRPCEARRPLRGCWALRRSCS